MASPPTERVTVERIATNVRVELAKRRSYYADLAAYVFGSYDNATRQKMGKRVRGIVPFSDDELAKVAEFLGVTVASLYDEAAA